MPLGYSWETVRSVALLAAATIAAGVVAGVVAYIVLERPEEMTCAELQTDSSKRAVVTADVARDLDIPAGAKVDRVVTEEVDRACARGRSSDRPVNSDLRGTIRQRLDAPGNGP